MAEPTACVIVMGYKEATLKDEDMPPDCVVVARCTPCVNTERVTFPKQGDAAEAAHDAAYLSNAELKPAETHVFTFKTDGAAKAWLSSRAKQLAGKVVFKISPAVEA